MLKNFFHFKTFGAISVRGGLLNRANLFPISLIVFPVSTHTITPKTNIFINTVNMFTVLMAGSDNTSGSVHRLDNQK